MARVWYRPPRLAFEERPPDGQVEIASPAGSRVQQWVFEAGGRAVTVALVAPVAVFDSALADALPVPNTLSLGG
jgi:hypothetical protein